jgi:hypothetical protein
MRIGGDAGQYFPAEPVLENVILLPGGGHLARENIAGELPAEKTHPFFEGIAVGSDPAVLHVAGQIFAYQGRLGAALPVSVRAHLMDGPDVGE